MDSINWTTVAYIYFAAAAFLFLKRWWDTPRDTSMARPMVQEPSVVPRSMLARHALNYMDINLVLSEANCIVVVAELRRKCQDHKALGFDCEWVSGPGFRNPVALLQLSSIDGYCGLFRLNQMNGIPKSLKDLLEDRRICKVGVQPSDDAKLLFEDYSVHVGSTLDIRHIARLLGYNPGGLANLSISLCNIILDKEIAWSDWEAGTLTERQIQYAAADAHIAVEIFVKLVDKYENDYGNYSKCWSLVRKYVDVPFM